MSDYSVDAVQWEKAKGMVVLDRIHSFGKPAYCIHGETWCVRCEKSVWLGSETVKLVKSGVAPLCSVCANELAPPGTGVVASRTIHDHLRADGPHDD